LAFQLADDLLDAEEDAQEDGPPNFTKLLGEEGTKTLAEQTMTQAIDSITSLPNPTALLALAEFTVRRNH
jgi:geranylgeranyl pyrophosphate synthase